MKKYLLLISISLVLGSSTNVSAQINQNLLESPIKVTGGSEAGKFGEDSKLCSEQKRCSKLNPQEREIQFKLINSAKPGSDKPKTWVVIHGWNDNAAAADKNNNERPLNKLAQEIARTHPGDNVIMLDWSEASNNTSLNAVGPVDRGNYYAATWIRPVAEKAVERLRQLGLDDALASQNLNLVGHSLGSILSAEIGSIYKKSQLENQLIKKEDKIGVNTITALDPASEINLTNAALGDLGGYDVDGRTPAYKIEKRQVLTLDAEGKPILNIITGKFLTHTEDYRVMLPKENVDSPKNFRDSAGFSRAFVGAQSIAGNQSLAATANESFQMYFGSSVDFGNEHKRVVSTFANMVKNKPFSGFWGIDDNRTHDNMSENSFSGQHEGIFSINDENLVSTISLSHKDQGEVTIRQDGTAFRRESGEQIPIIGGLLTGLGRFLFGIPVGEAGTLENTATTTSLFPQQQISIDMLVYNGCMAQVSSSHIGSASCSFKSPNQAIQDEALVQTIASRSRGQSPQQANQYTNGQIVKVPLDIGLSWNQSTKLDLDSHLVTPNSEHIYFSKRGNLNESPNAFLYRDSIPDGGLKGAEQTRITQFQNGEYRFYVYNFSDSSGSAAAQAAGPNGLSNSGATVKLYEGGATLTNVPNDSNLFDLNDPNVQRVGNPYPGNSTFTVPTNQPGNTWYVFKLNTKTGILYRVDRLGNSPNSIGVPNVR